MVLRLYKETSCVTIFKEVARLIFTKSGNLEVRIDDATGNVWKKFLRGKDFHSFTLTKE